MEEIDVKSLVNVVEIHVITARALANIFHTEIDIGDVSRAF